MDKKFFLAFLCSLLILILYPFYLQWVAPDRAPLETPAPQEAPSFLETSFEAAPPDLAEAPPAVAEEELDEIEDPSLKIVFSSRGASVVGLFPKALNGTDWETNLIAPAEAPDQRGLFLKAFWKGSPTSWWDYAVRRREPKLIEYVHEEPGELRIVKRYALSNSPRYTFRLTVLVENLSAQTQRLGDELVVPLFVGDVSDKEQYALEVDYYASGQKQERPPSKIKKQGFLQEGPVEWAALSRKYFALVAHPDVTLEHVRTGVFSEQLVCYLKAPIFELRPGETLEQNFLLYAGPQSYNHLKAFGFSLEKLLYTRVLGPLWVYLLIVLNLFYKLLGNYGWAVVAASALMKLLFSPLTHMSYASMRKMQELQPKIRALQEQFKKDPQRLNQETMQLYKRHKVNPFGGCLPLLIQMPVFIAFYQTLTQAVELRGAKFVGWIKDLSLPDQLFLLPFGLPFLGNQINIMPLIMIGTMVWQQKVTPQPAATQEQRMLFYMMPIVMGFVFYGLPSGLVIYWIVSNLLTILHQILFKKIGFLPSQKT